MPPIFATASQTFQGRSSVESAKVDARLKARIGAVRMVEYVTPPSDSGRTSLPEG
jgi:hypothetical protein